MEKTTILLLPFDVIANINQHLDLVSTTSLMDTCQHFRYMFLSSKHLWRKIHFTLNQAVDLHRTYSSLRKLGDSNGLNQHVREVDMDGCDDSHFSPIVMLVKFPNLRVLSAANRPENTNFEVDIKLLQEMLRGETMKPNSLQLERLSVYNHQLEFEPHFITYQKLWNKLSKHKVILDIRQCLFTRSEDDLDEHMRLLNLIHHTQDFQCQRIINVDSECWDCGFKFDHCWKCVPMCGGCKRKRLLPLANENQIKLKSRRKHQLIYQVDKADEDEFSVFD